MMALTMVDKNKIVLKKLLSELDWRLVSDSGALVMRKGAVTLVAYSKDGFGEPKKSAVGSELCGYRRIIHSDNFHWYVESDGFLVASGSIKRTVKDAYDLSYEGTTGAAAKELVEEINSFSLLSRAQLMELKQREFLANEEHTDGKQIEITGDGIGNTKKFVVDLSKHPNLKNYFKGDTVYCINSIKDGQVVLEELNNKFDSVERSFSVPLSFIAECEKRSWIFSVQLVDTHTQEIKATYKPILHTAAIELDDAFSDFVLSTAQRSIVAECMLKGLNFTPLLDNSLSISQMTEICRLLEGGADGSVLIGKQLSAEHLNFLQTLTANHLPLDEFLDKEASIAWLKRHYSEISEAADVRLQELTNLQQFAKDAARRLIFQKKDYGVCLSDVDSKAELELKLQQNGRFNWISELMLESGVVSGSAMTVSWVSLNEEQKTKIFDYYKSPGLMIGPYEFNQFLEERRDSFLAVWWVSGEFRLRYKDLYLVTDYNSVYARDASGHVLWRSVYVNEKYYTYCAPSFLDYL